MAKIDDEEDEPEKYVGRIVRKYFQGFGLFSGKVVSFDYSSNFFKVVYDDGDKEDLDLDELKQVLTPKKAFEASKPNSRRGQKGRKGDLSRRQATGEAGNPAAADDSEQGKIPEDASVRMKADEFSPLAASQEISRKLTTRQLLGYNNAAARGEAYEQDSECNGDDAAQGDFQISGTSAAPERGFSDERRARTRGELGQLGLVDLRPAISSRRTRARSAEESSADQMPSTVEKQMQGSGETDPRMNSGQIDLALPREQVPPFVKIEEVEGAEERDFAEEKPDTNGELKIGASHEMPLIRCPALMPFLPPSSKSLREFDDCIAELLQVYSLLRSFSTVIFLSPFSLEEFAHALRSEDASPITDCVHLSLLQTLRRQLERLSKSGSKSATFTLRLLDWTLLDQVTWPSFLMGYLLTQGFRFEGRNSPLKNDLMNVEYYHLPVKRKMTILSFLCNQVLASEEGRAEIARRAILEQDPEVMDPKGWLQKKPSGLFTDAQASEVEKIGEDVPQQETASPLQDGPHETSVPSTFAYIRVGRHLDEDGNLDECVLCAMDGNLICCDGCPAAYHSRCVGVTRQALPSGDWFCPECRADGSDQRGARISKGVRGGELLGIGPGGQFLFDICGYLLLSETDLDGCICQRWYSHRDLPNLLTSLGRAGPDYNGLYAAVWQFCLDAAGRASSQVFSPLEKKPNYSEGQVPRQQQTGEVDKLEPTVDFSISDPSHRLDSGLSSLSGRLTAGEVQEISERDGQVLQENGTNPESVRRELGDLTRGNLTGDQIRHGDPMQKLATTEASRTQENVHQRVAKSEHVVQLAKIGEAATPGSAEQPPDVVESLGLRSARHDCAKNGSTATPTSVHEMSQAKAQQCDKLLGVQKGKVKQWFEREVEISSAWIDTNAAAYVNKYGNCDFVATAALNLAAMAGGVDDLVDDRSGTLKRAKPSSVSDQLKAFTQASGHFFWPSAKKKRSKELPREKCGWCINCRGTSRRGCLLTNVVGQMAGGASLVVGGIRATKGGFGHHPVVVAYILHLEENLRGLLIGPWESAGHSKMWRKQVEQAKTVGEVKAYLLQMETNLRRVALIPDWHKLEDDAPEAIANSTILSTSSALPLNKKSSKVKRGRPPVVNKIPGGVGYDGACFGRIWWRGGRVSRLVYNWESISHAAIRRAARQGGVQEIPELVYPRGLDLPRRTRQTAWRTRLGKVKNIGQMAVEVRFLDTFVKWHDIISPAEGATNHVQKNSSEIGNVPEKREILAKSEEDGRFKYLVGCTKVETPTPGATGKQNSAFPNTEGTAENSAKKKQQQAKPSSQANADESFYEETWLPDSEVPLRLLKEYEEKIREINHSKLESVKKKKKKKVPGGRSMMIQTEQSTRTKKNSFWDLLCGASLPGLQESKSKPKSNWICGFCSKTGSESEYFKCHKCTGEFHLDCAQVDEPIDKFPACKTCISVRHGQRTRKPSYKMLDTKWQVPKEGGPSKDEGKLRSRKDKQVAPPEFTPEPESAPGRNFKRKKHLLPPDSSDSEGRPGSASESAFDSAPGSTGKRNKRSSKRKSKDIATVVPSHRSAVKSRKTRGTAQKKGRTAVTSAESNEDSVDEFDSQGKRGRKRKISSLNRGETPIPPNSSSLSSRGRLRGRPPKIEYNFKGGVSSPTVRHHEESSRRLLARDLEEAHDGPMLTRRKIAQLKENFSRSHAGKAKRRKPQLEVEGTSSGKRTRLKIIFRGQEVTSRNSNRGASAGGDEEDSTRRSVHGLDFGCRSARSEADIQKFRDEKLILAGQVLSDEENGPVCSLCSEDYTPGYVYVCCDRCSEWFHGDAVGVKSEDAGFLVGFKCHRCRKCRTPSCPVVRNLGGGIELESKTKRRGSIDDGEVIDSENLNSAVHLDSGSSSSLQSSYSNSPAEKEFSAFDDAKAFPDFVAATNQAEEALAADGSNFGQSILTGDFDMSDLGLAESHLELSALSLGDPHGNVWANNGSVVPLDLPAFSASQADISSRTAPLLSFTELLASDDYFEGVAGTGPELNAVWPEGVAGSGDAPQTKSKPPAADDATLTGLDKLSLPVSNTHPASSSQARSSISSAAPVPADAATVTATGSCTDGRSSANVGQEQAPGG